MQQRASRARQSGKGVLGCLLIVGILVVVVASCGYFGWQHLMGEFEKEITAKLGDNEVLREHLGEIQEIDFAVMATGEIADKEPGKNQLVFDVVGSKGKGTLIVEIPEDDSDTFEILGGRLELEDGTVHDLEYTPPAPAGAPEEAPVQDAPVPAGER